MPFTVHIIEIIVRYNIEKKQICNGVKMVWYDGGQREPCLVAFYDQEMERVYSFNARAYMWNQTSTKATTEDTEDHHITQSLSVSD